MNGWFKEQAGAFESQRQAAEGGRAVIPARVTHSQPRPTSVSRKLPP